MKMMLNLEVRACRHEFCCEGIVVYCNDNSCTRRPNSMTDKYGLMSQEVFESSWERVCYETTKFPSPLPEEPSPEYLCLLPVRPGRNNIGGHVPAIIL